MAKRAQARRRRSDRGAGGADVVLPALSTLSDLPAFEDLVASEGQVQAFAEARDRLGDNVTLACVARLDRGYPALVAKGSLFRAEFATRLTKGENSRVAVGDWVVARRLEGHEMGLIEQILPRRCAVERWRGGSRGEMQTLAANVDLVIAVYPLSDGPIDCAQVARAVVVARDAGVECAVALTKADRQADGVLEKSLRRCEEFFGSDVRVVAVHAESSIGVEEVRALVSEGRVAIVLGATGAGKSTLLNALLGHEALKTGEVRESDDMGRHTTVTRRMVKLPGAGVVVDEPGFRNLLVVGHERGLARAFPDIAEAARECRFRNCTHTHEPGCAVRDGGFAQARVDAYVALAAEMRANAAALDPDVVL